MGGHDVSESDYNFASIIIRQLLEVDNQQNTSMSCISKFMIFTYAQERAGRCRRAKGR